MANQIPIIANPIDLNMNESAGTLRIFEADLLANASDPDGDVLSVLNLTADSGTLVYDPVNNWWGFTPNANFTGLVNLTYDVTDGTDTVSASGTIGVGAYLVGTNQGDTLTGTAYNDIILGEGGNDILDGGAGDDLIDGGKRDDIIYGGDGNDVIDGGGGADTIDGGAGNDTINGGKGNDTIWGGEGNDTISGNQGKDTIYGEGGNDFIDGGTQNDTVDGGTGDDLIYGFNGNDVLNGGTGNDHIEGGLGNDTIDGGDADLNDGDIAIFTGASTEYTIVTNADGSITVTDTVVGRDGTDTLLNFSVNQLYFKGDTLGVPVIDLDADDSSGATGSDFQTAFTENSVPIDLTDIDLSVADDTTLRKSFITLQTPFDVDGAGNPLEVITLDTALAASYGLTVFDNGTDAVTIDGIASVAEYQALLRTVQYQHLSDAPTAGTRQITFSVIDADNNQSIPATTFVTVTPVNDAPVAVADTVVTDEDVPVTILASALLANDTDVDGDVLSLLSVSNVVNGTAVIDGSGNVLFTPGSDFNGTATFDYTVSDGNGGTSTATVSVDVAPVNDAPVPGSPIFTTAEDTALTVTAAELLAGSTDVDGDVLSVTGVTLSDPAAGTLVDNLDGTWTFTPAPDWNGSLSLNYGVSDGTVSVATSAAVTVSPVNDAPVVEQGIVNQIAIEANTFSMALPVNVFSDVDGDVLTYGAMLANGSALPAWLSFDGSTFSGTPSSSDVGVQTIVVTASDPSGETVSTSFDLQIDAQLLTANSAAELPVDGAASWKLTASGGAGVLSYAVEGGGAALDTATAAGLGFDTAQGDVYGTVHGYVQVRTDGTYDYRPVSGYSGADAFSFRVTDERGLWSVATVNVGIGESVEYAVFDANDGAPNDGLTGPLTYYNTSGVGNVARKTMTQEVSSGKWYFEVQVSNGGFGVNDTASVGITAAGGSATEFLGDNAVDYSWRYDGNTLQNGVLSSFGTGVSADNDVVMVAVDLDNGFVYFGKNGAWFNGGDPASNTAGTGAAFSGLSGAFDIAVGSRHGATGTAVHSAHVDPATLQYAPPSGFGDVSVGTPWAIPTDGHDTLEFGARDDVIDGQGGDDLIIGNGGNDTLSGGSGNDHLYGGAGADSMDGGADVDAVYYNTSTSAVNVNLETGAGSGGDAEGDSYTNIEIVHGSENNDTLTGDAYGNTLFGHGGDDALNGGGGDDTLAGGHGGDSLYGGAGNDKLYGDTGNDHLYGGAGADIMDGGADVDAVYYNTSTSAVSVNLETGVGSGGDAEGDTYTNIEIVHGSEYDDTLTGDVNGNTLFGHGGNDTLNGGGGSDTLAGGYGNDTLFGQDGNDVLYGDPGDDVLDGGAGMDTLVGGAGNDTYIINTGDGQDVVNNIGEGASSDAISYGVGIDHDQLWFAQSGNDLVVSVIGTTDQVSVQDWYGSTVNHVASIETSDGYVLTNSLVENLVTAMAAMTPPPVGQTELTTAEHTQLDPVLAANWQSQV